MRKKPPQKQIKKIQKDIEQHKDLLSKLEIRPCQGDADIKQKDIDIEELKQHIHFLEEELDRSRYFWQD